MCIFVPFSKAFTSVKCVLLQRLACSIIRSWSRVRFEMSLVSFLRVIIKKYLFCFLFDLAAAHVTVRIYSCRMAINCTEKDHFYILRIQINSVM